MFQKWSWQDSSGDSAKSKKSVHSKNGHVTGNPEVRKIPHEGVTSTHLQYICFTNLGNTKEVVKFLPKQHLCPQDIRWFWPAHCGTKEHIWILVFGKAGSQRKMPRFCFLLFLAGFSLLKQIGCVSCCLKTERIVRKLVHWYHSMSYSHTIHML